MGLSMGNGLTLILGALLMFSVLINLQFLGFERKFPTMKVMRIAWRKSQQIAFIHDPEGGVTAIPIKVLEGSNQLDLGKAADAIGIKFVPRGMNEAEFIDGRLPAFHYMGKFPHSLPVRGIAALSKVHRLIRARRIVPTQEKLNTVMHRDLTQPIPEIRATMVPGSETRIPDEELMRLSRCQQELKTTPVEQTGPFVFAEAHDFLHSVGMSAAVSLREWKSYITTVARGEMQPKAYMLDVKSVVMLLIGLGIAWAISNSGSMSGVVSSVKV